MKAKIIVFLVLLELPLTVQAADKWTKQDYILQGTYLAIHMIDWGQTKYIADHPLEYRETNRILGEHPSVGEVNRYFLITSIAHTTVTHFLPQEYRKYWQLIWIGVGANAIVTNYSIGIRIDF